MKIHALIAVIIPVLLTGSIARAMPASTTTLAYLKSGWLWTAPLKPDGALVKGMPARRACKLWPEPEGESVRLTGSRHGGYVAVEHSIRLANGAKPRYGLVPGGYYDRIHLIALLGQPREVRVLDGGDPSLSPDGKELAFSSQGGVSILNIASGHIRLLRRGISQPNWSMDDTEIAAIYMHPEDDPDAGNGGAVVINYASGKIVYRTEEAINPSDAMLSPNGRYVAILHHLSRPLLGHEIYDRKRHRQVLRDFDKRGYAPGILYAWSVDGKWTLWNWRKPNPENTGSWLWNEVGLVRFDTRAKRTLGRGVDPEFAPDSRHVLWLSERPNRDEESEDVMWSSFSGGKKRRLVEKADAFTIVQN